MYQERKTTNFKHTNTIHYGGYIMYFKLYGQLWGMLLTNKGVQYSGNPKYFWFLRILIGLSFILKTPWWLIIKPLGCLFTKEIVSEGIATTQADQVIYFEAQKHITLSLLGIPIAAWDSTKFSEEEMRERTGLDG